jgi:hypothetical protein
MTSTIASFFDISNTWFGYIANFFFAASAFAVVARLIYKLITKHYDNKVDEIIEAQAERFEEIMAQYKPNGGSSVKDQMNRIETAVEDLKHGQEKLNVRIDNIKEDFAEHKGYHRGLVDGEV